MNKEALLKTAALLDAVPVKKFDMRHWHCVTQCGCTHCAFGLAIENGVFPGYSYQHIKPKRSDMHLYPKVVCQNNKCSDEWRLARKLYGISMRERDWLFVAQNDVAPYFSCQPPPAMVAAEIRAFVEAGGIPATPREDVHERIPATGRTASAQAACEVSC